jgi:hypothetical protein
MTTTPIAEIFESVRLALAQLEDHVTAEAEKSAALEQELGRIREALLDIVPAAAMPAMAGIEAEPEGNGQEPHVCPHCVKQYKSKDSLRRHLAKFHA